MTHFEHMEWADYVRGMTDEAHRAAMQAHLEIGCKKCKRTETILRGLAAVGAAEGNYQVPQSAVRCARAIFAFQQPEKVYRLPRLLARLVYDSFREPLPAGVRTQQRRSRQSLYEAGDFQLDLRVEQERGSSQVSLVGQIENRREPARGVSSLPVFLSSGKRVVARTVSNQFGEFHLNYEPKSHLRLCVPVLQGLGQRIEVPLNDLHLKQAELDARPVVSGTRKAKK